MGGNTGNSPKSLFSKLYFVSVNTREYLYIVTSIVYPFLSKVLKVFYNISVDQLEQRLNPFS